MASALRMTGESTTLLVVDVQEKLLPAIPDTPRLLLNVEFLIDAARMAGVPVLVTEQYPQGLGATAALLSAKLPAERPAKKTFSCCGAAGIVEALEHSARPWVVLAGIETHVCVSQTTFDLLDRGFRVALPVDALASRFTLDHEQALKRLAAAGATVTTAEAAGFEWLVTAEHPEFKQFSQLVQARARRLNGLRA